MAWLAALLQGALLALASAVNAEPVPQPPAFDASTIVTKVRLAADRIEYSGLITHEANVGVFELYQSAEPKPRALLIESQGGSADAGMELGTWLFEKRVEVHIDTYCLSSCANYVFPAGRARLLAPHASLMWHGGVTQPITREELGQILDETLNQMSQEERRQLLQQHSRDDLLQQLHQSRIAIVAREALFFRRLGVDQRITTLGHRYERELLKGQGHYPGWDFSLEDMARLGIRDISIEGGAKWQPVFPLPGQEVFRIRLDELPGFRPGLAPSNWRQD